MGDDDRLKVILDLKDMSAAGWCKFQGRVAAAIKSVTSLHGGLATEAGGYALKKLTEDFWDVAAGFEQMEAKLDVMTKGRGKKTIEEINAIVLDLPVSTRKAVGGFPTMIAMGLRPTTKVLQNMIDVASVLDDDVITRLSLQLGQAAAKGRLMTQDLNIMAEAGINARRYLREAFSLSLEELQKSNIDVRDQIRAIFQGMEKDFGGSAQRMKMAGKGLIGTFKSYATEITRLFMNAGVYEEFKEQLDDVNQQMRSWLKQNQELIKLKVPEYIDKITGSVSSLLNLYDSMPDDIVGAAGYGIMGRILLGKGPGFITAGLKLTYDAYDAILKRVNDAIGDEPYPGMLPGLIGMFDDQKQF